MPVSFLTIQQKERYGRYQATVSANDIAGYFYLNDDDLDWISKKRSEFTRLGYALQLTSVRFLGTFLESDSHVPSLIVQVLASQVNVANLSCLNDYWRSEQRWRHTTEIRTRY
ncbi:MAG TPA: DUF4158 domain-containing protein, partial [Agitococcus sp.]|nr:DUF4158 domain-containing protein [Agitococcus sp.]